MQRRLEFERLDGRELCAIVGVGGEGTVDDRISVPITIDDATGLRAAEVRLRYNSEAWSVEPSSVKPGSAWSSSSSTIANVDAEAGEITVFVFAGDEQPANQGTLVDLEFTPQGSDNTASPSIELQSVRLNEGAITASREDGTDWDEDYINPRVRATLAASSFPRLWRDPNAPMGPLPLTPPPTPEVPEPVSPAPSWLLMAADEDLRLRKRAA
jgi:hypothetical protein